MLKFLFCVLAVWALPFYCFFAELFSSVSVPHKRGRAVRPR